MGNVDVPCVCIPAGERKVDADTSSSGVLRSAITTHAANPRLLHSQSYQR